MHRYRASCSGALATYYGLHCRRKQILLSPLLINCRQLLCWGGPWEPLPGPCWNGNWLDLVPATVALVSL